MAKKSLTVKEAKLVKAKAQGMTLADAYEVAGYAKTNRSSAAVNANKVLKKESVQEALHRELSKQGITLEKIIKPIKDGLEAERVAIVGNGDQAMAEVTPDHSIRLKSSAMAQKLMGLDNAGEGGVNIHFHQHQADQKAKYDL